MRKFIVTAMCGLALAGCAQPGDQGYAPPGAIGMNKTTGGALIGAGLGGLAGSQIGRGSGSMAATAVGVILGGLIGSQVGSSLDRADQLDNPAFGAPAGEEHRPVAAALQGNGFDIPAQIRLLAVGTVAGIAVFGENGLDVFDKIHRLRRRGGEFGQVRLSRRGRARPAQAPRHRNRSAKPPPP